MSNTVDRIPFYRLKHCQTVAANGKTVFAVTVFVPFSRQKQCSGQCQTSSVTSMPQVVVAAKDPDLLSYGSAVRLVMKEKIDGFVVATCPHNRHGARVSKSRGGFKWVVFSVFWVVFFPRTL